MLAVRVVAVAEHSNIYQVRRRCILPHLGVDAGEVDIFVAPVANPVVAGIGYEVWEAADVFIVFRLQPIAPDHLHGALLAAVGQEPQ